MNNLEKLQAVLISVCNHDVTITKDTDLLEEEILDSLDAMVFFMTFEEEFKVIIPGDIDLKENGYYKVSKLLSLLP